MCHCSSSWSTSLFATAHVSRQFSGNLLPGAVFPLTSMMGKMEWNLMISATESNIWGAEGKWAAATRYDAGWSESVLLLCWNVAAFPGRICWWSRCSEFSRWKPSSRDTRTVPRARCRCSRSSPVPERPRPVVISRSSLYWSHWGYVLKHMVFLYQRHSTEWVPFHMKINCKIYFLINQSVLHIFPDCKFRIYQWKD